MNSLSLYEDALEALQGIAFDFNLTDSEKRANLILLRDEIEDMIANLN
jgi:hypothetical protein